MRVYLLMRAGVHLCDSRARGPLPPIQDLTFKFHEYAGEGSWWKVLHDAGPCFAVEAEAPDAYCEQWLLPMPEANVATDIETFLNGLCDAAVRDSGSLGDFYAHAFCMSLGLETEEQITAARGDEDMLFWSMRGGLAVERFDTRLEELERGLMP